MEVLQAYGGGPKVSIAGRKKVLVENYLTPILGCAGRKNLGAEQSQCSGCLLRRDSNFDAIAIEFLP